MGFFKRLLAPSELSQPDIPPLGSGRRLRSNLTLADCMADLETVIRGYRQQKSVYRTPYVLPGWRWNGTPGSAPATVIAFDDTDNYPLFAAFWPAQSGAECALFPLGSGDERLTAMPITSYGKQRDPSLVSIGVVPQGQLSLRAPQLPDQYFNEILKVAGFPSSPRNLQAIGKEILKMFVLKATEFIASKDPRSADASIDDHVYHGGSLHAHCQGVLDALAAWRNPIVLPYIQDLPMRCKAFLLEHVDDTATSFWNKSNREQKANQASSLGILGSEKPVGWLVEVIDGYGSIQR